jgi:hypothetical protein
MDDLEKKIIINIFEDMLCGVFPKFGSPETKCDKCMFYKVVCLPAPEHIGCYCGWKREAD